MFNTSIPSPTIDEYVRMGSSILICQPVYEKENSELKPVTLRLKIDLVSYGGIEKFIHDITYSGLFE